MNTATSTQRARVLSSAAPFVSAQGTTYAPGVSAETVQSKALFLGIVSLDPGQRTRAHTHELHESAFYVLEGDDVELWSGEQLQHCDRAKAGDFLYIPAKLPHIAVNRSATRKAVFVGARNEPTAMESVLMQPELDAKFR
jgi:uncharacterized RmlC-like cupin family protein